MQFMSALTKSKKIWQRRFVRFAGIGLVNTLVDFIILNILVFTVHLDKIPANIISVSVAMCISYLLNHYLVFRSQQKHKGSIFFIFVIITASGLFIAQNLILHFLTENFQWPAQTIYEVIKSFGFTFIEKEFVILNFAKAIATIFTMLWNYMWYKKVVFLETDKTTSDQGAA